MWCPPKGCSDHGSDGGSAGLVKTMVRGLTIVENKRCRGKTSEAASVVTNVVGGVGAPAIDADSTESVVSV